MVIFVYFIKRPREWFFVVVVAIPVCLLSTGPSMDDRPWTTLSGYIAWTGRPRPKKELIITGNRSDRFFYDYKIKKLSSFSTLHMFELAPKFEN